MSRRPSKLKLTYNNTDHTTAPVPLHPRTRHSSRLEPHHEQLGGSVGDTNNGNNHSDEYNHDNIENHNMPATRRNPGASVGNGDLGYNEGVRGSGRSNTSSDGAGGNGNRNRNESAIERRVTRASRAPPVYTEPEFEEYEDEEDAPGEVDDEEEVEVEYAATNGHQRQAQKQLVPNSADEASSPDIKPKSRAVKTRTGRETTQKATYKENSDSDFENSISPNSDGVDQDEVDDLQNTRRRNLRNRKKSIDNFVIVDEDDHDEDDNGRRRRSKRVPAGKGKGKATKALRSNDEFVSSSDRRATRAQKRSKNWDQDGSYGTESPDPDVTVEDDNDLLTVAEDEMNLHDGDTDEDEADRPGPSTINRSNRRGNGNGRTTRNSAQSREISEDDQLPRRLRERKAINYALPPPILDIPKRGGGGAGSSIAGMRGTATGRAAAARHGGFMMDMNLGMGGIDVPNMGNMPDSDSDDDAPDFVKDMRKEAMATAGMALASGSDGKKDKQGASSGGPATATAGVNATGRFDPEAGRADADPLGVDLNVTFDQVGGLDTHINQLKEMVALPLLYPELFQQFGIIPPRGVLFHGPPGTGKTLLARALAASCSTSTTKIAFFMRKGADCLSKWVGEAERQLRLLFEEAKASQPSIIFFDEIDGLAPVRSSKQDQIHSSLVATLLALMDGMDGRGQVVVIGATNRPDTVDPALRRPGRFDREFYFPLPNIDARRKIISINTRKWQPPLEDELLNELASLTKGYGGADLRALCTESALNAIQRRYPQVYKTSDRLQLDPHSIQVQARDFMASIRKIVPSSARSASSSASPLPEQLVPLLSGGLDRAKAAIGKLLPPKNRPSVLEDAEWEDEDDGSMQREMMSQALENLRVYRPRMVLHGQSNLGQRFIGAALLHHLEGYHVQSLDLATLLGQSSGTVETMLVQMFIEAKRHQPSVLFIPSLLEWASVMTDTAKATFGALLDSLTPSEPVLVLALLKGDVADIPADIKDWFGFMGDNYIELFFPDKTLRTKFFESTIEHVLRPPSGFPDGVPRRRRILETLPLAAPLPPKAPSEASILAQIQMDQTLREVITYRLGPILAELKKKHKKATLSAQDAFYIHNLRLAELEKVREAQESAAHPVIVIDGEVAGLADVNGTGVEPERLPPSTPVPATQASGPQEASPAFVSGTTNGSHAARNPFVSPMQVDQPELPIPEVIPDEHVVEKPSSPAPAPKIPNPHWVDFDLMQNKLIDQDNGYLTLRAFLRDIEKMAENVNSSKLSTDQRQKAHSMVIEAKLMLKDHFQDEQQKLEIERMAAREYARRDALNNKKKGGRRSRTATISPRQSARVNGTPPEFTIKDLAQAEQTLTTMRKRQREEDSSGGSIDSVDQTGNDDEPSRKKARILGSVGLVSAEPGQAAMNGVLPGTALSSENLAQGAAASSSSGSQAMALPLSGTLVSAEYPPIAAPLGTGGISILNDGVSSSHMNGEEAGESIVDGIVEEEPVTPSHPEFHVPESLETLRTQLSEQTLYLDVEELEQLRAICLQRIWKGRQDWDRTSMVKDLCVLTADYITRAIPQDV